MSTKTAPAFAIVTMGRINASASTTTRRSFYRSLDAAIRDARGLYGPSDVRVVECPSVAEAKAADISDSYPVRFTR